MSVHHNKAWVVSVNMGYGHERAAFGLEDLAYGKIITANAYPGIPEHDKQLWSQTRELYELVSRLQTAPFIGGAIFNVMDYLQKIPDFYPRRDLSAPTVQLKQIYRYIRKLNLGKHLIDKLAKRKLPLISTFFLTAFAAEEHGYPEDIYLVVCDADMNRAWAPLDPKKSRVRYFASNGRVVERLKLYGVPEERIFLTGFPLPKSNIGGPDATTVKTDLMARMCNLDPNGIFLNKYSKTLHDTLGLKACDFKKPKHPLTITFSVGGAGAHRELAMEIAKGLRSSILRKTVRLNLEAGTRKPVADFFLSELKRLKFGRAIGEGVNVHVYPDRPTYFHAFAKTMRTTDVLWTKPSELSFYCGLGMPIIMAPPIGSQEEFNRQWLMTVNAGTDQLDPQYVGEWLFDWLNSGGLARFAWNGFIEAPTHGTYRIESVLTGEPAPLAKLPLIV